HRLARSIAGPKPPEEDRQGEPAARRVPRGDPAAAPRDSRLTPQPPTESGAGVTMIVSPTRPPVADSAATPRRVTTRQLPGGPSTARRSGTARVESPATGQSLGERQSYGPHSSTIMAVRSRRVS